MTELHLRLPRMRIRTHDEKSRATNFPSQVTKSTIGTAHCSVNKGQSRVHSFMTNRRLNSHCLASTCILAVVAFELSPAL